jgi:tricorn protease
LASSNGHFFLFLEKPLNPNMKKLLFSLLGLGISTLTYGQGTQLLRQPTLSQTEIVFVYADDLWKVSKNGGTATRLTSNEGEESFPHFSPDGKWIAFTGEYDGNTDVYLIASDGSEPKRLTWHPGNDQVTGWSPDGKKSNILLRQRKSSYSRIQIL